jgi:hypothetical protein
VAVLSFLIGVAFTNPSAKLQVPQSIEAGFEPPTKVIRKSPPNTNRVRNNKPPPLKSIPQTANSRIHIPRIIGIQISPHSKALTYQISSSPFNPNAEDSIPEGHFIEESWYESNAAFFMDGHDFSKCVPMEKWQLESFVDCNKFHELDLQQMRMINRG